MFSIGLGEIAVILILVVLLFSPKDLPKIFSIIKEIKKYFSDISREINDVAEEISNNKIELIKGDDGKFYPAYKEIEVENIFIKEGENEEVK